MLKHCQPAAAGPVCTAFFFFHLIEDIFSGCNLAADSMLKLKRRDVSHVLWEGGAFSDNSVCEVGPQDLAQKFRFAITADNIWICNLFFFKDYIGGFFVAEGATRQCCWQPFPPTLHTHSRHLTL